MSERREDAGFSAVAAAQSLHEDLKVAYWILVASPREGVVRAIEAAALVRSLHVTMHAQDDLTVPIFDVEQAIVMPPAHALNVTFVTMATTERMGFGERDVREIGLAALLKDIGEALVPPEVLAKTGPLSPDEQARLRRHPVDGARLLIETEEPLELPAIVAYEHHAGSHGGGYPAFRFQRRAHFASRLIRIVDVFCALLSRRPHRSAWQFDEVLAHIEEGAGVQFDRNLAARFVAIARELEPRILRLERPDAPLPWAGM